MTSYRSSLYSFAFDDRHARWMAYCLVAAAVCAYGIVNEAIFGRVADRIAVEAAIVGLLILFGFLAWYLRSRSLASNVYLQEARFFSDFNSMLARMRGASLQELTDGVVAHLVAMRPDCVSCEIYLIGTRHSSYYEVPLSGTEGTIHSAPIVADGELVGVLSARYQGPQQHEESVLRAIGNEIGFLHRVSVRTAASQPMEAESVPFMQRKI